MSPHAGNVYIFEKQFGNNFESLNRVTEEALHFLAERGLSPRAINLAHLAIEEMATNTIKYGYDDTRSHQILLRIQMEPGSVEVVLEDDAHEFNPLEAPPPDLDLPIEDRKPGGMGIHLIRNLAAQMGYQRHAGRNRVNVRIAC